jgi:PAS domain S-box-containing protein
MPPLWVTREAFLESLSVHPWPQRAGEGVWESSEPWLLAMADLADTPGVLLDEFGDWAALLDRHSLVRVVKAEPHTQVFWENVPGVAADPRECAFRKGALAGLLSRSLLSSELVIEHSECLAQGDESCLFTVRNLLPVHAPAHSRAFRETFFMTAKLQGHEAIFRRLEAFSARVGPFPDVQEMRAVRRFMEEIEDIILIFDRDLCVLDANRAAVRLSGLTLNELRGLSARDLMDPDSFEIVHSRLPLLFERGALSGLTITGRMRQRDIPLEVAARVAANGHNVVCIARDVSRHLHLERELEARNQLLQSQNKRISEAGRLKSEFLANVGHELTTPLTCIKGFAKLLRRDIDSEQNGDPTHLPLEKRSEFLGIVQDEARRMSELIGGLLELSKIESGAVALDRTRVSLNGIVEESLRLLKPRVDEHELKVILDLDANLPLASLDPGRMKQVVLNLVDNAIKFSPAGSEIQVGTRCADDAIRLKVRNYSGDLRKSDLTRIFARFVQRDGSFTREHGGVGLGLNLVRAIVELHGGRVWAGLPEPGRIEFTAEIPLSAD